MKFFELFKKKEPPPPVQEIDTRIIGEANAILYPKKIVISTINKVKEGFGVGTNKVSILPSDVSNELLGIKIKYHLSLTLINQLIPKGSSDYKLYLKAAGFKSAKASYVDAKQLHVSLKNDLLKISPSVNGGPTGKNRGFRSSKNEDIVTNNKIGNSELGGFIREGWGLCK